MSRDTRYALKIKDPFSLRRGKRAVPFENQSFCNCCFAIAFLSTLSIMLLKDSDKTSTGSLLRCWCLSLQAQRWATAPSCSFSYERGWEWSNCNGSYNETINVANSLFVAVLIAFCASGMRLVRHSSRVELFTMPMRAAQSQMMRLFF